MKETIRSFARFLFDRSLIAEDSGKVQHIVAIRWDAKLGDSIVSSFFFREIKKNKGITVTVLTVDSLAAMHQSDLGVDRVIMKSQCPGVPELLKIWRELGHVDVELHLVGRNLSREVYFYGYSELVRFIFQVMNYKSFTGKWEEPLTDYSL